MILVTVSIEGWSPDTHARVGRLVRHAANVRLFEEPPLHAHMLDPQTAGLVLESATTCIAAIALFFQLRDRALERRDQRAVSGRDVVGQVEKKLGVELGAEERLALVSALSSEQGSGRITVERHEIRYRLEAEILTIEGSVSLEGQD
jgi:hypothetical protein